MEEERAPTQPKHEHGGKNLETKKEWSPPRFRKIRTDSTKSQEGLGDDGSENAQFSAS